MKLIRRLLLAASVLLVSACGPEEPEAPELTVRLEAQTVSAAHNSLTGTVDCKKDWEVSMDKTAWATVEKDAKKGGFTVSFDPNNSKDARKGTVVVKAGKSEQRMEFTQSGRNAFFTPYPLVLSGTDPGSATFDAPAAWTASVTSGEEWLQLTTLSGAKGASALTCAAKSENTGESPREATVRLKINGGVLDLTVSQAVKTPGPTPPDPPAPTAPTPALCGIDGVDYVLGENGWNQSSRVVLSDGGLQYLLMNRAATDVVGVLNYSASAAVGTLQQVQVFRMNKTGVLHNRLYQVKVMENTDTYILLQNSAATYFVIQK